VAEARRQWSPRDRAEAYTELDHPADLFLEIHGSDLPILFEKALCALYDQVAELEGFTARRDLTLAVEATGLAEALRALLAEALYRFATEGFVATGAEVTVEETGATRVRAVARLWGETADKLRHVLTTEVKAVTYHQLAVEALPGDGWRARVLLDV